MVTVVVLAGGSSDEREISIRSGNAVAEALRACNYNVKMVDPANNSKVLAEEVRNADVVFPVLHGKGGEDGTIQEILQKTSKPYVGSGITASKLCFNKWLYKQFLQEHGIPTPKGELVDENEFLVSKLSKQPFVLKPVHGGSSVDTFIVRKPEDFNAETTRTAFKKNHWLLLEELIDGTEITIGVLGNKALPAIEIIPPAGGEFDYDNKYNGKTQELCPPRHVPTDLQSKAQKITKNIHTLTGCQDMSRTDIIIDKNGNLFVLETNTIPGMTIQSLFPKAAKEAGVSMPELVMQLVEAVSKRQST